MINAIIIHLVISYQSFDSTCWSANSRSYLNNARGADPELSFYLYGPNSFDFPVTDATLLLPPRKGIDPFFPFRRPVTIDEVVDPTRGLFDLIDRNNDGTISVGEYRGWLTQTYHSLMTSCLASGIAESRCKANLKFMLDLLRRLRYQDPNIPMFPNYIDGINTLEDGLRDMDADGDGLLTPCEWNDYTIYIISLDLGIESDVRAAPH